MTHCRAWRNFRRMQDMTALAAGLIYAAGALRGIERLPGGPALLFQWILLWPAVFLAASLIAPLAVQPIRRWLRRYVWMSYKAGFGQTPGSVVIGICLLLGAGLFIYGQIDAVAATGRFRANVFSAYASGIGVLIAQAVLVRDLQAVPEVRAQIEADAP